MNAVATPMPIPDILKDFRARKRLSQRSLARHLGVSANAVNEWEHGGRTPDPAYCEIIADKLELPVEFVLAEAGGVPLDVVMGQLGHRTPTMSLQYGRQGREARNIAAYREFDATKPRQQEQAG